MSTSLNQSFSVLAPTPTDVEGYPTSMLIFAPIQFVAWWITYLHLFFVIVLVIGFVTWRIPQVWSGKAVNPLKAKDDKSQNCWVINGRRYDLTPWLDHHPGGRFALILCQGTDCTGLFETYHSFSDREKQMKIMQRFEIPESSPVGKDIVHRPQSDTGKFGCPFHQDLKKMCRDHFAGMGKTAHKAKWSYMVWHAFVQAVMVWGMYRIYMYYEYWPCLVVGLAAWHLTGNVAHEASHFTYSSSWVVNRICSMAGMPFSFNSIGWHLQHVAQHHIFTNSEDDVDLQHFLPVMRVSKHVPHKWNMRFQALVFLALLLPTAITHLGFVVPLDMLWGTTDPATGEKRYEQARNLELFRSNIYGQLLLEFSHFPLYITAIILHRGFEGLWCMFPLWSLVMGLCSLQFLFCTQATHLQHDAFEGGDDESWAKRQINSSYDYSQGSKFWALATGGLNMQALHHCLPCVSASHYHDMYPKFREVCNKHDVKLREYPSAWATVKGFWAWILECSMEDLHHGHGHGHHKGE